MKIGIVGGGILGLSLGYYLQKRGYTVHIYERNPYLGGLACSFDYGSFIWDKFYHVILSQDTHLLGLLKEIGLEKDLRWRNIQTGYYAGGTFYSMSNTRQRLQFPLLSWPDKFRMGLATIYALRFAEPGPLYQVTAEEWLIRIFGRSNYTSFWKPLLRAKYGKYADKVAAVCIWAALKRLFGTRTAATNKESMGYVHGGYHHILQTLRDRLESQGCRIYLGAKIKCVGLESDFSLESQAYALPHHSYPGLMQQTGCRFHPSLPLADENMEKRMGQCGIEFSLNGYNYETHWFNKVIFTAPKQAAVAILLDRLRGVIEDVPDQDGAPTSYLGVVCLAVVLRRPLTPYYVLNIADECIPLTGMIEMTGLINSSEETRGLSLVYLPRYVDSQDPFLRAEDAVVYEELFENGLKVLFPDLAPQDVVSWHVQRAQYVQPLSLVCKTAPPFENKVPRTDCEFVLANTALLACPTLNNDEVVGLAKEIALRF